VRVIGAKLARLTVAGGLCGIVGVIVIYAAWRLVCPYAEELQTRREIAVLQERVDALHAEHDRLAQQAQVLQTPEGVKLEARRLGMLAPGERSLRFMTRPEPRKAPRGEPPPPAGALARVRAWARGLLARPEAADQAYRHAAGD